MKHTLAIVMAVIIYSAGEAQSNTVNAVIGDISFLNRYHELPGDHASEQIRIQTHLSYVEQILRAASVHRLTRKQQRNREVVLGLLHNYWSTAVFPKNYDHPGRRPCFIDRDGNICAVGYLIEKTESRQLAEKINKKHQYAFLLDMKEEVIRQWADKNGLTEEECAMIQPSYGYVPTDQTYHVPIKTGYGISSGLVGGLNVGINILQFSNRHTGRTFSCIGLVSGTSQIILGLASIRKNETESYVNGPSRTISYQPQNNLSYVNIAAGTTTVITSAVNLFINRRIRDKRNAVSLYSYPDINNRMVTGLAFTRNL